MSLKESINNDGQQFLQYKKKIRVIIHFNSLNMKKTPTHVVGNLGPGLAPAQAYDGLNWLMGSQTPLLDNWISNHYTDINKR